MTHKTRSHMENFDIIKAVCSLISREKAKDFAKAMGMEFNDENGIDASPILTRKAEILTVLERRGVSGGHGTTRSGSRDSDGNWLDFAAFTQVFYQDAPWLKKFLNETCRYLRIKVESNTRINVSGFYDSEAPDFFFSAHYFVGAKLIYAVNLASGKVIKLQGRQCGGAFLEKEGAVMELNVEQAPDIETIIHELIHLNLPEGVLQQEAIVETVANDISELLSAVGYIEPFRISEIEDERAKAIEVFHALDEDLAVFLT